MIEGCAGVDDAETANARVSRDYRTAQHDGPFADHGRCRNVRVWMYHGDENESAATERLETFGDLSTLPIVSDRNSQSIEAPLRQ